VIIDFHTHIWSQQADQVPEFVAGLDRAGVDRGRRGSSHHPVTTSASVL